MAQRPILIAIPVDDSEFASRAEQTLEDGVSGPAAMQATLRIDYPKAIVRARDLSSEPHTVWYVYREGRWIP